MDNPPNLHQALSLSPTHTHHHHQPRTTPNPPSKSNPHPPKPQSLTYIAYQCHLTTRPLIGQRIPLGPPPTIGRTSKEKLLCEFTNLDKRECPTPSGLVVKDNSIPNPILYPSNVPWILVKDHVIAVIPYHPKRDALRHMPYVMLYTHTHRPKSACFEWKLLT